MHLIKVHTFYTLSGVVNQQKSGEMCAPQKSVYIIQLNFQVLFINRIGMSAFHKKCKHFFLLLFSFTGAVFYIYTTHRITQREKNIKS